MLKAFGIMIIMLTLTVSGEMCARGLKKRISSLEAFIRLLDSFEAKVSSFGITVKDFFADYSDDHQCLEKFCKNITSGISFSESVKLFQRELFLEDADVKILFSFGKEFGQYSLSEELKRCNYYKNELKKALSDAKEKLPVKTKLLRSSGVMCGILVAVLLI